MNGSKAGRALRALQKKPPRNPVTHICPKCKQTIMGTREFRKHKPLCGKEVKND